jgi:hypothetical protein
MVAVDTVEQRPLSAAEYIRAEKKRSPAGRPFFGLAGSTLSDLNCKGEPPAGSRQSCSPQLGAYHIGTDYFSPFRAAYLE